MNDLVTSDVLSAQTKDTPTDRSICVYLRRRHLETRVLSSTCLYCTVLVREPRGINLGYNEVFRLRLHVEVGGRGGEGRGGVVDTSTVLQRDIFESLLGKCIDATLTRWLTMFPLLLGFVFFVRRSAPSH